MIGVIDYGHGNIRAFLNIYNKLHIDCKIVRNAEDFEGVKGLILPGVGAFDKAMEAFNSSGMRPSFERSIQDEIPVLGICVGMQMLAESSEEGVLPGLGLVPGRVRKIDFQQPSKSFKIPHMGWNQIETRASPLFVGIHNDLGFYFLHSYYFECESSKDIIATCNYQKTFTCAVNRENIFGVQFHPEKSHQNGIIALKNFASTIC